MLHHEELTGGILGAAFEVHSRLGPGLLESAYQACLGLELLQRRIPFEREVPVQLTFKDMRVDCGYRLDFLTSISEDSVPLSPPWCSVLTVVKKLPSYRH